MERHMEVGAQAAAEGGGVLSARGLAKSFGSLVVAKDIHLALPRGVRYALIGPNGAGKTTLINLMTGMLRPDAGRIFLGEDEITSLKPEERVRRGLVRTFQINSLFPHLSALEAVTLAVCERRGDAPTWWKRLPDYRDAVDEAHGILSSLRLATDCYRLTRELAYGRQRLLEIALALGVVRQVLVQGRVDDERGVARDEEGIAVGRGFRHRHRADVARAAGAVLDDHLLLQGLGERRGEQARVQVGAARGRRGHDELDRARGPGILGLGVE
jgi:branched-chain amino acid transport system ATP-binding protein